MLFWLKKAATVPFLPLYFWLLAGLTGVALSWSTRYMRLGRSLICAGMLVLFTFSNRGIARLLLQPIEHRYKAIPEAKTFDELPRGLTECVAIVVLGAGHADAPGMSRVNQLSTSALARIAEAVRLARLLPAAKFVVSGHHIAQLSHAQVLGEAAVSLGVSADRIERMDEPRDTEDEINERARAEITKLLPLASSLDHVGAASIRRVRVWSVSFDSAPAILNVPLAAFAAAVKDL